MTTNDEAADIDPDADGSDVPETTPATAAPDPKRAKRKRRRKILLVTLIVLVSVPALSAAAITYYVSTVPVPESVPLADSTTVYYSDGKTVMATLGIANRTVIDTSKLPDYLGWAVMSAEDRTFETNPGVDIGGVVWAAVGNSSQGASTITMQYARVAAGADDPHSPRVAAMAWKLDDKFTKQE